MATAQLAPLLASMESLRASERDTHVAKFALSLPPDAVAAVIEQLSSGTPFEKRLARVVAIARQDVDWIIDGLADPDPAIHIPALRAVQKNPKLANDEVLKAALDDASASHRAAIVRAIHGRPTLANSLIVAFRTEWGDAAATTLLSACSPEVVEALLPDLFYAIRHFRLLAICHPETLCKVLFADLEKTFEADRQADSWWLLHGDAMSLLLRRAPRDLGVADRIMAAFEKHPGRIPDTIYPYLHSFSRKYPARVLNFYKSTAFRLPSVPRRKVVRTLHGANPEAFAALACEKDTFWISSILNKIPWPARPNVCHAVLAGKIWPARHDTSYDLLLRKVPRTYSAELVRRVVDTTVKREYPTRDILRAKFHLPFDEVIDEFLVLTRDRDADQRREAWSFIVQGAAWSRDPAVFIKALDLIIQRLKNEQSIVRDWALCSLAEVDGDLWTAGALPRLGTFAENILGARDVTGSELHNLNKILRRILVTSPDSATHVAFVLTTNARLNKHSGSYTLTNLEEVREDKKRALYDALAPALDIEMRDDKDYPLLMELVRKLDPDLNTISELLARVLPAIKDGKLAATRTLTELYLEPRKTRSVRVAEVLAIEPSAITFPIVITTLAFDRTDLLAFDPSPLADKHIKDESKWILDANPSILRNVSRWSASQQSAFIDTLEQVAANTAAQTYSRRKAIRCLGALPAGLATARKWSQAEDSEIAIVEAGIVALGGSPDDLPLLLSYASKDTARVAMYAAGSSACLVKPSVLFDMFKVLLSRKDAKVTARKEAVRVVGALLPATRAAEIIRPIALGPDTHRDVRVACVAEASRSLLAVPAGWEILGASLDVDQHCCDAITAKAPAKLAEMYRPRYAKMVATLANHADDDTAGSGIHALTTQWAQYVPDTADIMFKHTVDMTRKWIVWHWAADGLMRLSNNDAGAKVCEAAKVLLAGDGAGGARTGRERVEALVSSFGRAAAGETYRTAARALAVFLSNHDCMVKLAATLLLGTALTSDSYQLQWDGADAYDTMIAVGKMCAGRPALGYQLSQKIKEWAMQEHWTWKGDALLDNMVDVAGRLTDGGGAVTGMFAVELAAGTGLKKWNDKAKAVIIRLRSHAVADVRDMADGVTWKETDAAEGPQDDDDYHSEGTWS